MLNVSKPGESSFLRKISRIRPWGLIRKTRPSSVITLAAALLFLSFLTFHTLLPFGNAAPPPSKPGWKLVFSDEFEGAALNRKHWTSHYPWGRTNAGNHEGQYYPDSHVQVRDGHLELIAGKNPQTPDVGEAGKGFPYASGMIASHGKHAFRYGYFETRAELPAGKGIWPAFWLHKADPKGWLREIDVLENLGHQPDRVHMTLHYEKEGKHYEQTCAFMGPNFHEGFHTFGVRWKPDALTYYIDGVERCHFTQAIPQEPMYLIANLAVGGDWPGMPDATTRFPQTLRIDYIRVYREAP